MAQFHLEDSDPFDRALIRMLEMNRRKRTDYASGDNQFLNFEINADMMRLPGYDRKEDCLSMVMRKVNRITNLRGREPSNEAVLDSYEDLAVYATLLFAMALEESGPAFGVAVEVTEGVQGVARQNDPIYQYTKECYEPNHKNCRVDDDGKHYPGDLVL